MDKFVVRDATGSVDVDASAAAYAKALTEWCAKNEVSADVIETAVEAVFDRHSGRILMPALLSMAVAELNGTPDQFNTLTSRVRAYVKGQAGEGGRLEIGKGKQGGVLRLAKPGEEVPAKSE